jgi:hypothetical protein
MSQNQNISLFVSQLGEIKAAKRRNDDTLFVTEAL